MTEVSLKELAEERHRVINRMRVIDATNAYGKTPEELAELDYARQLAKVVFEGLNRKYHKAIAARVASSQQKACEK